MKIIFFPSIRETQGAEEAGDFQKLAEQYFSSFERKPIKGGKLFSLAIYGDEKKRRDSNVIGMGGIVLDFDDAKQDTYEILANELEDYPHVAYSTYSATEENPKFRVILPFKESISKEAWAEVYRGFVAMIGNPEGLDAGSRDLSRAYFMPITPLNGGYKHWIKTNLSSGVFFDPSSLLVEVSEETLPIIPAPIVSHSIATTKSSGRNNSLKAQACACLAAGKTILETVEEIMLYDLTTHSPPLFRDASEGFDPNNPELGAFKFVSQIWQSVARNNRLTVQPIKKKGGKAKEVSIQDISKYYMTAQQLVGHEFAPVQFIIEDTLPEGFALLCGRPKLGKSWLALDYAMSVSEGGEAMGAKGTSKGTVLYLALEDNLRRLQNRIRLTGRQVNEKLHLVTSWPKAQEGGIEQIQNFLAEHPDTKLIIIDTLARFRGNCKGQNVYQEDTDTIAPLQALALEHKIAMLVIHHTRKLGSEDWLDTIGGSTGLSGAADTLMVLKRERGQADAFLLGSGRDIADFEFPMNFNQDTKTWQIVGIDTTVAKLPDELFHLLALLEQNPNGLTTSEIMDISGQCRRTINRRLNQLELEGLSKKDGESWKIND